MTTAHSVAFGYFAVAALEIAAEATGATALVWATKPLLMPILATWVWVDTRGCPTPLTQALFVSLVFSLLGDVFLVRQSEFFLWGLGSFLVAHLAYVAAFWSGSSRRPPPKDLPRGTIALTLPIHLYTASLIAALVPGLGDQKVPVLIYIAVIFAMAISSALRRGRVSPASFWPVYAGAIAFVVSDSVIAIDRFVSPVPYVRALNMITYVLAQYWITRGLLIQHMDETGP